jgi:nicotinamidase-related amidase
MTTLSDRPNTALLVIDVQNGVIGAAHERAAVVGNIAHLVDQARREAVPVVWVQHDDEQMPKDSDEWHTSTRSRRRRSRTCCRAWAWDS